jgi:hypothetical protein
MVDGSGNRLPLNSVVASLKLLVRLRNEVAHNRPLTFDSGGRLQIGRDPYERAVQDLEQMLAGLRFDVAKALSRILPKQFDAIAEGIVRNGGEDPRRART